MISPKFGTILLHTGIMKLPEEFSFLLAWYRHSGVTAVTSDFEQHRNKPQWGLWHTG